jgi:hypothetical protein
MPQVSVRTFSRVFGFDCSSRFSQSSRPFRNGQVFIIFSISAIRKLRRKSSPRALKKKQNRTRNIKWSVASSGTLTRRHRWRQIPTHITPWSSSRHIIIIFIITKRVLHILSFFIFSMNVSTISANQRQFLHPLIKKFPCGTNSRQWRDIEWPQLTLIGVDHLSHVNQKETKKRKRIGTTNKIQIPIWIFFYIQSM